jgi:hypothetical protein
MEITLFKVQAEFSPLFTALLLIKVYRKNEDSVSYQQQYLSYVPDMK